MKSGSRQRKGATGSEVRRKKRAVAGVARIQTGTGADRAARPSPPEPAGARVRWELLSVLHRLAAGNQLQLTAS
jgi:hypothetical protein